MSDLTRIAEQQAVERRVRAGWQNVAPRQVAEPQDKRSVIERGRWIAVGAALTAMTVVVGVTAELVLGTKWLGLALAACVAAVALAAWYTVSGRTLGTDGDVRERVLERHYIGVAWYGSMLRNTLERGGYERGLRRELTRLAAARVAQRHGVNLYRDPQTAAQLIGPDLWPLVDPVSLAGGAGAAGAAGTAGPGATRQTGARPPEVPIRAVAELIERLERM